MLLNTARLRPFSRNGTDSPRGSVRHQAVANLQALSHMLRNRQAAMGGVHISSPLFSPAENIYWYSLSASTGKLRCMRLDLNDLRGVV